jgi:hypothetical protein
LSSFLSSLGGGAGGAGGMDFAKASFFRSLSRRNRKLISCSSVQMMESMGGAGGAGDAGFDPSSLGSGVATGANDSDDDDEGLPPLEAVEDETK